MLDNDTFKNLDSSWDNQSGSDVEAYIKQRFENAEKKIDHNTITGMTYDGSRLTLLLKDGEGVSGIVTPMTPVYNAEIKLDGLYINEVKASNNTINYKDGTKYALGVYLHRSAITTESTDILAPSICKLTISTSSVVLYSSNVQVTPVTKDNYESGLPYLLDISDIISDIADSDISFNLEYLIVNNDEVTTVSDKFSGISIVNPRLVFKNSSYIATINRVLFEIAGVSETDKKDFTYEVYNNGVKSNMDSSDKNLYTSLQPGLNLLNVRAICGTDISTNWISVDIIYTNGYNDTCIAINEVPTLLANQAVDKLYHITIFSKDGEDVKLNTYIENNMVINTTQFKTNIDSLKVVRDDYSYLELQRYYTYDKDFSAYIELSSEGNKYLGLEYKPGVYYSNYKVFLDSRNNTNISKSSIWEMMVEAPDTTILPYSGVAPLLNFSQTTNSVNNVFADELLRKNLEIQTGYRLFNGKNVYYVPSTTKSIFEKGYIDTSITSASDFTLELGITSLNVSSEESPVFTLGKIQIKPTEFCWKWDEESDPDKKTYLNRNAGFNIDEDTHIVITYHREFRIKLNELYYPKYMGKYQNAFDSYTGSINLLKIYINGVVAREIALTDIDLAGISNQLDISPKSSDVAISCLKVWNTYALTEDLVRQEYVAFLGSKSTKQLFIKYNDILNTSGEISWVKAKEKFNTLVFVYPKGSQLLSRAAGGEDNKDNPVETELKKHYTSIFVNYANPETNKIYGGRINKLLRKAQGSSAKRYWHWNILDAMDKFSTLDDKIFYSVKFKNGQYVCKATDGSEVKYDSKPKKIKSEFVSYSNENFNPETNTFLTTATPVTGGYLLPATSTSVTSDGIKVTKLVGKVNYASSMQSHKLGACELYDATDPHKSTSSRKAVKELPFLYFYYIIDDKETFDVNNIELANLISKNSEVKFMGLMTWGSGKCDKNTWDCGSDDVLVIEGAENEDMVCNFQAPWHEMQRFGSSATEDSVYPKVTKEQSIADPLQNALFYEESLFYQRSSDMLQASWDIDTNVNDSGNGLANESAKETFKKWREFYDTVYKYDPSLELVDSLETANKGKKACISQSLVGYENSLPLDIYRYCTLKKTDGQPVGWVPAGEYYNGTRWETLNLRKLVNLTTSSTYDLCLAELKILFKEKIELFIDVDDVAHHLAVIKFLSGTDNRAKNTYFKVTKDNKILLYQDDLDTIFITDNQGKLSKAYNLIEPSYDESTANDWGDAGKNIFFRNFDLLYEDKIIEQLAKVYEVEQSQHILENYFYGTQNYFPAVAYNHTARIYYELGLLVKNSKALTDDGEPFFKGNKEEPITLSHGRYLEGELYFINKRNNFLRSYAKMQVYSESDLFLSETGAAGKPLDCKITFSTFLDMYPLLYDRNGGGNNYIYDNKSSAYKIINNKVKANTRIDDVLLKAELSILMALPLTNQYKTLTFVGFSINKLNGVFSHLTELTINSEDAVKAGYLPITFSEITAKFPVILKLEFIGVGLPEKLDLSEFLKLQTINLSKCTNIKLVNFPTTQSLTNVTLPKGIQIINLSGNPGLKNLTIEDWDSVTELHLPYSEATKKALALLKSPITELYVGENELLTINVSEDTLKVILRCGSRSKILSKLNVVDSSNLPVAISWETAKMLYRSSLKGKVTFSTVLLVNPRFSDSEFLADTNNFDLLDCILVNAGNVINSVTATINGKTVPDAIISTQYDSGTELKMTINGVEVRSNNSLYTTVIRFEKHIPQVGDYAYCDGSFSSRKLSKTVIGIVWYKEGKNVYIVSNRSVGPYTIGPDFKYLPNDTGNNSYLSELEKAGETNLYALYSKRQSKIISLKGNLNQAAYSGGNTLPYKNSEVKADNFKGKELTKEIILAIDNVEGGVSNINDERLNNDLTTEDLYLCPYYYKTYLYEPSVLDGETLDELYKSKNWYVPCINELAYVFTLYLASCNINATTKISLYNQNLPINNNLTQVLYYDGLDTYIYPTIFSNKSEVNHSFLNVHTTSLSNNNAMHSLIIVSYLNYDYNTYSYINTYQILSSESNESSDERGNKLCATTKRNSVPFVIYTLND